MPALFPTFRMIGLAILLCSLPFFSQGQTATLVDQFTISSEGSDVLLTWDVPSESGISEFRLFRRVNDEATAAHVVTLSPNGGLRYSHLDDGIFKTTSRVIHYELQVVQNGQVHRYSRSISHNPTSIQRTWGSIKAMFRY